MDKSTLIDIKLFSKMQTDEMIDCYNECKQIASNDIKKVLYLATELNVKINVIERATFDSIFSKTAGFKCEPSCMPDMSRKSFRNMVIKCIPYYKNVLSAEIKGDKIRTNGNITYWSNCDRGFKFKTLSGNQFTGTHTYELNNDSMELCFLLQSIKNNFNNVR